MKLTFYIHSAQLCISISSKDPFKTGVLDNNHFVRFHFEPIYISHIRFLKAFINKHRNYFKKNKNETKS